MERRGNRGRDGGPGPCGMTRPGIEAKPAEQSTKAEQTGQEPTRAEQTRPELTRAEQTGPEPATSPPYSLGQSLAHPSAAGAAVRPGPACWRCGDPGHFQDHCPMMEVGLLVWVPDSPGAAPDQAGQYQIPVSIKGGTYQALVDSGCNQTSIHQSLIQQRALDTGRKVKVRCVHGDVADYPLVPVSIKFRGKMHRMEVAVNSHLKHPLILGTDWPAFTQLLGIVCADASWQTGRGQEEAAARTGEALTGPSPPASEETRASEGVKPPELDDFPLEQSRDETLKNAYDRVRFSGSSPAGRPPLLPLFFPYKREVVSGNPRCPVKGDDNPVISPPEPSGNAFSGGTLFSHGRPLGGGKNTRTPNGPIFLAGHSRERPPVVCGVSGMPAGKSTGHRQSALASITVDGGPLRENWDGPHRAIGAFRTRIPLCISPSGLCNAISGSSAPALHLGEECSRGTVSNYLLSGNPERDSH